MKRFAIAAAVATVLGMGLAGTASAQYIQPYSYYTPNGGLVSGTSVYNLGTYQSYNTYYSPYGSVRQNSYFSDAYGDTYGRAAGYNPNTGAAYRASTGYNAFNGFGYNRGFYQPNTYVTPYGYGGYRSGFYGRRW